MQLLRKADVKFGSFDTGAISSQSITPQEPDSFHRGYRSSFR